MTVPHIDVTMNIHFSADIHMFKVKKRKTGTVCEICSKLTIKAYFTHCSDVPIVGFEQVNAGWVNTPKWSNMFKVKNENKKENPSEPRYSSIIILVVSISIHCIILVSLF